MKSYKELPSDSGSNIIGQVTAQANRLQKRLASVKHTVAIMSGKGGVGKSSLTANLATALTLKGKDCRGRRCGHQRTNACQDDGGA